MNLFVSMGVRYLPCKGRLSGDRSRWPFGEQHLLEKSFICLCILAENIALKNQSNLLSTSRF